jgi:hypothetical protein
LGSKARGCADSAKRYRFRGTRRDDLMAIAGHMNLDTGEFRLAALIASAVAQQPVVTVATRRRRPAATPKGRPSKAAKTTPTAHRAAPPARHEKRAKNPPTRRNR